MDRWRKVRAEGRAEDRRLALWALFLLLWSAHGYMVVWERDVLRPPSVALSVFMRPVQPYGFFVGHSIAILSLVGAVPLALREKGKPRNRSAHPTRIVHGAERHTEGRLSQLTASAGVFS